MSDFNKDFYSLIHGMQKNERRMFSMDSGSKAKSVMLLYQLILDNKISSDEELKANQDCQEFLRGKNLSKEKDRLLAKILETLRNYHAANQLNLRISERVMEIKVLEARGKKNLALEEIKKVKALAEGQESWTTLLDLLVHERRLTMGTLKTGLVEAMQQIQAKSAFAIRHLEDEQVVRQIWYDLLLARRMPHFHHPDFNGLREKMQALQSSEHKLSFFNQMILLASQSLLALTTNDLELAQKQYSKAVALLQANKLWVQANPKETLAHIFNYCNICHSLSKYEQFPSLINFMKRLEGSLNPPQYTYSLPLAVLQLANTGKIKEALDMAEKNILACEEFALEIPPSFLMANYFNLFVLRFLSGNYSGANQLFDKVWEMRSTDLRKDLQDIMRAYSVFISYEMEEERESSTLVESKLLSLKRKAMAFQDLKPVNATIYHELSGSWGGLSEQEVFAQIALKLKPIVEEQIQLVHSGLRELWLYTEAKARGSTPIALLASGFSFEMKLPTQL